MKRLHIVGVVSGPPERVLDYLSHGGLAIVFFAVLGIAAFITSLPMVLNEWLAGDLLIPTQAGWVLISRSRLVQRLSRSGDRSYSLATLIFCRSDRRHWLCFHRCSGSCC